MKILGLQKRLFSLLEIGIKNKIWISYNDHNASSKVKIILNELLNNKVVSLVSDAGTPLLSDPGYKLLQETIKNQLKIIPIPGPSALTSCSYYFWSKNR